MTSRTARRDAYRLLGGLLERYPALDLLDALARDGSIARVGKALRGEAGAGLCAMHDDLARGVEARRAIRRDYVRLFVGPRKKLAPPWESVYRSPEQLVMQEHERQVLRAYAAERVGFDGMGRVPADHVGFELQFVSLLIDRARRRPAARAALRRFLRDHLCAWAPAFAADVEKHADTGFFRGVARALAGLCAGENGAPVGGA